MRLHPFASLLPAPDQASRVAAPPYDVVNRAEARAIAADNPASFLHVGRSDIDLPDSTDQYDPAVYRTAREALDRLVREGSLRRDAGPGLYLYRQVMDGRAQVGVVGCVHIDDYEQDLVKKHEKTRPDKEDDRTRHVLALDANAEPVFLTYRDDAAIDRLVAQDAQGTPIFDFSSDDGVRHTGWRVRDTQTYVTAFGSVPWSYVADGHHRTASAWRAGRERRAANPSHTGAEEYNWFLSVLFPASQLRILPYNRVIKDFNGRDRAGFMKELEKVGIVKPADAPVPSRSGTFAVFPGDRWYQVDLDRTTIDEKDPLASLDVSLVQDRVLGPILGIGDPRTDKRIDFVGGIRGTAELERRVKSGEMALAISMFPTAVEQLLRVADAGLMMPPKSTWFEPKLKSGLFVHLLS
ncbi:MAG TPA: DUF1015 family protein [Gemmatimonadales bacterium]|nr:DUF1015 family protein [Gemmatimonadales bacterium]